jgi:hypothetical protein
MFGLTESLELIAVHLAAPWPSWHKIGDGNGIVAMTSVNGRLFAVSSDSKLCTRLPVTTDADWTSIGTAPDGTTAIAGHAGKLIACTKAGDLLWRDAWLASE